MNRIHEPRDVFKQLLKQCSKQKIFKEKQHHYSAPLEFTSWRQILGHLVSLDTVFYKVMEIGNTCDKEASIAGSYVLHQDSPVRNISRNLGKAFLKTSTRGIIKPPIAFEHFIINLPKGLLFDELNQPLNALLVMTGECFIKACLYRKVKLTMVNSDGKHFYGFDGLWIIGLCKDGNVFIDTTKWGNMGHEKNKSDLIPNCGIDPIYKSEADAVASNMRKIAVHSLLTMAYKPELLSESKPISSGHGFREFGKHKARNNVWIGKEFISKTRKRSQSDNREGAPVTSHWRRGHWHTYLTGKKREKHSLKWIEPIHVNAEAL
mgnify:FL=1|tara:strand:+ start:327 stop:1286 length:960 start_codon:yes stop_codon:yes gene_type:complete